MVFDTSLAFIGLYLLAVLTVEVPGWVITRVGARFEGGRFSQRYVTLLLDASARG